VRDQLPNAAGARANNPIRLSAEMTCSGPGRHREPY